MNKFASLSILALAALSMVSALPSSDETFSQVAIATDERETSALIGDEAIFGDFCIGARDYVFDDLKRFGREKSSELFSTIFNSASEITEEVLSVQKEAVSQLASQLQNPQAEISEDVSEREIAHLIEQGKKDIQAKGGAMGIASGFKAAGVAMFQTANSALFNRLAKLRGMLSPDNFIQGVYKSCDRMAEYEETLKEQLETKKAELAAGAQDPELKNFIETATLNSLHCFTAKNIAKVNGFCDIFKNGRASFFKMLAIKGF